MKNIKSNFCSNILIIKKKVLKKINIILYLKIKKIKYFIFLINIFLIFISINKIKLLKVCLCVIGKKENLYANEFVNHYKKIGYDKIFIYDNNNIGDEKFEDVLNKQISSNFVEIINFRGYRGKRQKPQNDAYFHCYEKNKKIYNWISFFDFDEFLILNRNNNIKEYLNRKRFKKCSNIKINWLIFSDNDLIYYENIPLQKRFTKPAYNDFGANKVIKSTVRGNLSFNFWVGMKNPHTSINNKHLACDSEGNITDPTKFYTPSFKNKFSYLKHFSTKTIEEYCRKIRKGKADYVFVLNKRTLKNSFNQFFQWNNKTKEKVDYFQNYFHFSIS